MKKIKPKRKFPDMYQPIITYDIRWIQMHLKEKYTKEYSEMKTPIDKNTYFNSVHLLNKYKMKDSVEDTQRKTVEEILQGCLQGLSVRIPHLLIRYVYIAMQTYADQELRHGAKGNFELDDSGLENPGTETN